MDLDESPETTNVPKYPEESKAFGEHPGYRQDRLGNKPKGWYFVRGDKLDAIFP